jgi:hypothetical protein
MKTLGFATLKPTFLAEESNELCEIDAGFVGAG